MAEDLTRLLREGKTFERRALIKRLGERHGDRRAMAALVALVREKDEEPSVKTAAIQSLRRMGDHRLIPDLVRATGDPNRWVRQVAVFTINLMLASMTDETPHKLAVRQFRVALTMPNSFIRMNAIDLLAKHATPGDPLTARSIERLWNAEKNLYVKKRIARVFPDISRHLPPEQEPESVA
jgi:HEAT repeat protein